MDNSRTASEKRLLDVSEESKPTYGNFPFGDYFLFEYQDSNTIKLEEILLIKLMGDDIGLEGILADSSQSIILRQPMFEDLENMIE
jgi:hypothetical protein